MPEHLQDDRDVEQILKLAVRNAGYSDEEALRQRLHAAAAELGLSDAQVAAAEEKYKLEKAESIERAEFESYAVKEFWEHFWAYVIVNGGMIAFDLFADGRLSWAMWPLIGWGIGLAFHAYGIYFPSKEGYDEEFAKWRSRRQRRRKRRGLVIGATVSRLPDEEDAKAD
jgi:hypothetical protein